MGGGYLYTDGQLVDSLEPFVGKLQKETAFSDSSVANNNIFEKVRVAHCVIQSDLFGRQFG